MMAIRIDHAARTHVGRRSNNEDNHCAEPGLGLYANVITRALGMDGSRETRPDLRCETLRAGDVFVLCTDGLIEKLRDETLAQLLAGPGSADAICARLVEEAYRRGGRDSITAVVLRVLA